MRNCEKVEGRQKHFVYYIIYISQLPTTEQLMNNHSFCFCPSENVKVTVNSGETKFFRIFCDRIFTILSRILTRIGLIEFRQTQISEFLPAHSRYHQDAVKQTNRINTGTSEPFQILVEFMLRLDYSCVKDDPFFSKFRVV